MSEIKETGVTILQKNLPTIEALIKMNSPVGISESTIKAKAMEELAHFQMLSILKPDILTCDPMSILLTVKQVIKKNLSLDPSQGLVYVMVESIKNKEGQWIKILTSPETANGKLSVARQCGRVLDVKRPTITYDANGQTETVTIEFLVPSVPSPRWEVIKFDKNHFKKWRTASHRKNSRGKNDAETKDYSNALYKSWNGGVDPEFAATKALRHSLSKLGTNINEMAATRIVVPSQSMPIVNADAANKEVCEETESTQVYAEYEEVKNEPTAEQTTPTIEIPDANDL